MPTAGRERRQKHQTGPLRHSPLFFRLRGGVWCFRQQNNSPVKLSDLRFLQIPYQRGRPRREKRHQRDPLGQIFRRRCRKGAVWCCRGVKPALATYTSRHRCRAGHLRHTPLATGAEPGICDMHLSLRVPNRAPVAGTIGCRLCCPANSRDAGTCGTVGTVGTRQLGQLGRIGWDGAG